MIRACERSVSGEEAGSRRSGNGAVSGTPVNGAERWAGNFAAPLTCSGHDITISQFQTHQL